MPSILITYSAGNPDTLLNTATVEDIKTDSTAGDFQRGGRRIKRITYTLDANGPNAKMLIQPTAGQLADQGILIAHEMAEESPETVIWSSTATQASLEVQIPPTAPPATVYSLSMSIAGGQTMAVRVHR